MKKLLSATLLVLAVVAVFGAGKVAKDQTLHNLGKLKLSPPPPAQTDISESAFLSVSASIAALSSAGFKVKTIGGTAHLDANHLYANSGNWLHLYGCQVDQRPGAGIFVNSTAGVFLTHYAKANPVILFDFIVNNPDPTVAVSAETSAPGGTPQTWNITGPKHVAVAAVATADGDYQIELKATLGVVELKGVDVSGATP